MKLSGYSLIDRRRNLAATRQPTDSDPENNAAAPGQRAHNSHPAPATPNRAPLHGKSEKILA
jgi:hypothetical protein